MAVKKSTFSYVVIPTGCGKPAERPKENTVLRPYYTIGANGQHVAGPPTPMTAKRRLATFRIDAATRTEQGALRVEANLTKTGIFDYALPDGGVVRELRPAAEVFSPASLDSLKGSPVTVLHPSEFVDVGNWRMLGVGFVLDARANDPYVQGTLVITDAKAIELIEAGDLKEISCGYTADIQPAPQGTTDYDVVQMGLTYNHAALGPENWGRLGNDVALRLDSSNHIALEYTMNKLRTDEAPNEEEATEAPAEETKDAQAPLQAPQADEEMAEEEEAVTEDAEAPGKDPIRAEDEECESTDAEAEEQKPVFDTEAAFGALNEKLDELLGRLPAAKKDEDHPAEEKTDSKDSIEALVQARVAQTLRARAAHAALCGPQAKQDGKTDAELCTEALATVAVTPATEDETSLLAQAEAAAAAAATLGAKADDARPSFAERLRGQETTAGNDASFADRLKARVN